MRVARISSLFEKCRYGALWLTPALEADGEEDIAFVRELFGRFSKNTRTKLRLFATTATPVEEAVHEAITV